MGARKRTAKQREAHLAEVARLYLTGIRQDQIAEYLEDSPQQITYDMKLLQQRWRASAIANLGEAKGKELAKIDQLEREYWAGWERSKQPKEKTRSGSTQGEKAVISAFLEKEQRDGNPAFLDGLLRCVAKRCEILGLDSPIEVLVEEKAEWLAQRYGLEKADILATARVIAEQRWNAPRNRT